jgi:TatD DNase family protein
MLVDTHCHLDFDRFDEDREAVLQRAAEAGVGRIVVPALDLDNARTVLRLAERHEIVYAAIGVHPNSAAGWQASWLDELRALAWREKVVAIGEIGLDYYWDRTPPAVQREAFAAQCALAAGLGLPVIVHNREASEDVLRILLASPLAGRAAPGVLHSFSASPAVAAEAVAAGFYLGFTGPLTFQKADELRAIAAQAPLDRLLVETDAPFLTPHPHRGQRNEPAYVALVAAQLAALHGMTPEAMAAQTTDNARRLFGLGLSADG